MWQFLTIVVLFGLMAGFSYVPDPNQPAGLIAGTGFVLLAAFTMGELFKRINLPALLGYIAAGIIFGPDLLTIVLGPDQMTLLPENITDTEQLAYIEILTVGVIGTLGGGELVIDDLRDNLGKIFGITALIFLAMVPTTAGAVYMLGIYWPGMLPLPAGASTPVLISASLMFGVFSFAMSPAATLAIIQESKAKGSFTSMVLGIVIVADLLLVASFLLTSAFSEILIETGSMAPGPLMSELPVIGAEFMWALVIGAVTGVVFILYFRFVAREMIFFTVGAIFAASYACNVLHAEKLLAFITAGFIVQNLSKHGHDMIEALEQISLPAFVIYFTLKAANLDLTGMSQYVVLTLILTALRSGAIWAGVRVATNTFAKSLPADQKRHLWISFFSRGGVDLVLASLLAQQAGVFGAWVVDFEIVIMAVVVVHIIAGPPLLEFALNGVGETRSTQEDGGTNRKLVYEDEEPESPDDQRLKEPLATPDFADQELQAHLTELHDGLTDSYHNHFYQPIETYDRALEQLTEQLEERLDEAIAQLRQRLDEELNSSEPTDLMALAEEIRAMHMRHRQSLQPQVDVVDQLDSVPVPPEAVDTFLKELRQMEDFDSHFRVEWEDRLLEADPSDPVTTRLIKLGRRTTSLVAGRSHRTVPVGRLWRYYLALSLPEYLSEAAVTTSEKNEAFWFELGDLLREFDTLYARTVETLALSAHAAGEGNEQAPSADADHRPDVLTVPMSPDPDTIPYFSEMDVPAHLRDTPFTEALSQRAADESLSVNVPDEPLTKCLARLDDYLEEHNERMAFLRETSTRFRTRLLGRLATAFGQAFDDFLEGVEQAGTIQLPGFRYRPSSRFDLARQAEERLDERLNRESQVVAGYQGWVVVDEHVVLFLNWFYDYRGRIDDLLRKRIGQQCIQKLRNLQSRCSERPNREESGDPSTEADEPFDWSSWLDEQLRPSVQRARRTFNQTVFDFSQGNATERLLDLMETRVERLPETVQLLVEMPEEVLAEGEVVETTDIPLRRWFMSELYRESALRFVEFNEHAERSLRRGLVALKDIEQILTFNLQTGQQQLASADGDARADEMAQGALERAADQLADLSDSLLEDEQELRQWADRELTRITISASGPFLHNRIADIGEQLEQQSAQLGKDSESSGLERITEPVTDRLRDVKQRLTPLYRQVRTDLERTLSDQQPAPGRNRVRQRLLPDESTTTRMPVIYRRLFRPIPMEIPDLYVPRPDLEQACLNTLMEWARGRPTSILIHGDRGLGKRTLLPHLLPTHGHGSGAQIDGDQVHTLQLGERVTSNEELCRALSKLIGDEPASSFSGLVGRLRNHPQKRIVLLKDAYNLFARTDQGLAQMRQFLQLVSQTSEQILWVVLLGQPATTFLDTSIDLLDYFTHDFQVDPMETEQIEQMISTRHRVSGFHLEFEAPESRLFDQLRHPIAAAEASRHPRRAYFDRLGRLSRGNPMLALTYWLESVEPDPEDDSLFRVPPLPTRDINLLGVLSADQRLLVASIVRHQTISTETLAEIYRQPPHETRTELEHLRRLGFIEKAPGQEAAFQMRPLAEGLVTEELRSDNLV